MPVVAALADRKPRTLVLPDGEEHKNLASFERVIDELIGATRRLHVELSAEIQRGRDRLLELASQRGATGGGCGQASG